MCFLSFNLIFSFAKVSLQCFRYLNLQTKGSTVSQELTYDRTVDILNSTKTPLQKYYIIGKHD